MGAGRTAGQPECGGCEESERQREGSPTIAHGGGRGKGNISEAGRKDK